MLSLTSPYPFFADVDGDPLDGGYIYIGEVSQDPETAPVAVYWDEAGTIPAAQPLRTLAGHIARNGSPARVYVEGDDFSMTCKRANGVTIFYEPSVAAVEDLRAQLADDSDAGKGAGLIGFDPTQNLNYAAGTLGFALDKLSVDVTAFAAVGSNIRDGATDATPAIQAAVAFISLFSGSLVQDAYVTLRFPRGDYLIADADGVEVAHTAAAVNICFESDDGANILGTGSNFAFKFTGGGAKNKFKKLYFKGFGAAILWETQNRNECLLSIEDCKSWQNDVFVDTGSYAQSRSSMVEMTRVQTDTTRVVIKHYTDHLTFKDCWFYAKEASYDALFYLSGDGQVKFDSCFFIPNTVPLAIPANGRWIDFVSDPANCTPADRSLKSLKIESCRASIESARPLVWVYDTCPALPSGNNQVSSIIVEDSYCGGTGGNPLITYKQGYPGSVVLRNTRVLSSPQLIKIDAGNTAPPVPSIVGTICAHVIQIDEATRLSQSNSFNASSLVDPALEPFVYDTTSQTSKFKRSIQKNIDYRLRAVAAPGAGANKVKVSLPVFFDSNPTVANRDILSFLLVTVSDADGAATANPHYRAQATALITIVGGTSGSALKRLVTTVLQDAQGGAAFAGWSAAPTVFWGSGDTGSADVAYNSTGGPEDHITAVWSSVNPALSWAYIVPLSGLRENQQDKMQLGVW